MTDRPRGRGGADLALPHLPPPPRAGARRPVRAPADRRRTHLDRRLTANKVSDTDGVRHHLRGRRADLDRRL